MRRLIVNADDFGLTDGIDRAVLELHRAGALHSATLMAAGPRFAEAVELAKRTRGLGVGCHVVLVDGEPVAEPESIPTLLARPTDGRPKFRATLGAFVRDLMVGRIARDEMEREAAAQIARLEQAGLNVTHIDTHKHTHMFPAVLDAVTRAAGRCGVCAVRNPFEPGWSLAATPRSGLLRRMQVRALGSFRQHFLRTASERGLATTDGAVGVLATGTLDEATLRAIVNRMPAGTWELVCHPAYVDQELRQTRTRLKESRAVELAALLRLPEILGETSPIHFGALGNPLRRNGGPCIES